MLKLFLNLFFSHILILTSVSPPAPQSSLIASLPHIHSFLSSLRKEQDTQEYQTNTP